METFFFTKRDILYCRFIHTDGTKKTKSTKKEVNPKKWHQELQHSEEKDIEDLMQEWKEKAKDKVSFRFLDQLFGKKEHIKLSELIKMYILQKELAAGTTEKYEGFANLLRDVYPTFDIDIREIDRKYGYDLYNAFTSVRMSRNSAIKRLENLSSFMSHAVKMGLIEKNHIKGLGIKRERKEIVFLTAEELETIKNKKFLAERMTIVRDIFIFQCYTGCEYSRVMQLKKSDIQKGVDGQNWLFTDRKKTDKVANLPILPVAQEMIDKYIDNDTDYIFPRRSNAKLNSYLKEIQDRCGIEKSLHTHLARHTFATTICLMNGLSAEVTATMMGITIRRLMESYGKIVNKRVGDEMAMLRDKLSKVEDQEDKISK